MGNQENGNNGSNGIDISKAAMFGGFSNGENDDSETRDTEMPRQRTNNSSDEESYGADNAGRKERPVANGAFKNIQLMLRKSGSTFASGISSDTTLQDAKIALSSLLEFAKTEINIGNKQFQLIPIDKNLAGTHYSAIVLAARFPDKKAVAYNILMLSGTGRKELTVNSILKAIPTDAERRVSKKTMEEIEREIVLPVDTFDEEIYKPYVEEQIVQKFDVKAHEKIAFINTFVAESDVLFLRNIEDKKIPTEEAAEIFEGMFNALTYLTTPAENDFDLMVILDAKDEAKRNNGGHIGLVADVKLASNVKSIRKDLDVRLSVKVGTNTKSTSVNAQGGEQEIVTTSIYTAAVLGRQQITEPGSNKLIDVNRAQPLVVISDITGVEKTLKFTLAGIIAAIPMIRPDMYPYAIMNSKSNWGELFKYQYGDVADESQFADLKSHEFTEESVYESIDLMTGYSGNASDLASLGIDISNSTLSSGLTILRAAADEDTDLARNAGTKIIKALNEITDGGFPIGFDPLDIFSNWTILPDGYYSDAKSGIKVSLQNQDLPKFIEQNLDSESITQINEAQISNADIDSYLETLEALEKVGLGSAIVTGKITRALFSTNFISALLKALNAIQLNIQSDSLVTRSVVRNFRSRNLGYNLKGGVGFMESSRGGFSGVSHRVPHSFKGARKTFSNWN